MAEIGNFKLELVAPTDLLCRWDDSRRASRSLAQKLFFSESQDQFLNMMSTATSDAMIFYDHASASFFWNNRPEDERLLVFAFFYKECYNIYQRAILEKSFDGLAWNHRFRNLAQRFSHQLWFCLAMLGFHDAPHFPLAGEQRENCNPEEDTTEHQFDVLLTRRMTIAVSELLLLQKRNRIAYDYSGLWESPRGWLHLWGLTLHNFALRSGLLKASDWESLKEITDGDKAFKEISAILIV